MKKIRDYLHKNSVYIQKEVRKLITDGFLGTIYEPTPSKWPINDPTDDPTDGLTDGPTDGPTNGPTDNLTLALLLLSTAPI